MQSMIYVVILLSISAGQISRRFDVVDKFIAVHTSRDYKETSNFFIIHVPTSQSRKLILN